MSRAEIIPGILWLEARVVFPTVPEVRLRPTLYHQDDTDTILPDRIEAPEWQAEAITGKHAVILYKDSKSQLSERQIICHRLQVNADHSYLHALCLLRQRPRAFRIDRIEQAIDTATGEIFEPGAAMFGQFAPTSISTSRFNYGLSPKAYADFNAALNVLAFIARCDGHFDDLEDGAIEDFAASFWLRSEIEAPLDVAQVLRHTRRLTPDAEALWTSLDRCLRNPVLSRIICRHIDAVILADGIHHSKEIFWRNRIAEMFRSV